MKTKLFSLVFIVVVSFFYNVSFAQVTFIGGSGNNFSTDANWLSGSKPTANADIIIAKYVNIVFDETYSCKTLTIRRGAAYSCSGGSVLIIMEGIFDEDGNKIIDIRSSIQICSSIQIPDPPTPTVQQMLDSGDTPYQIYLYDNTLLESLYGKTYQGGLLFYLDITNGQGLVAALADFSLAEWGCWGDEIGVGARGAAIGTGQANTTAIIAGCTETGFAAKLCDDYDDGTYDDWFLPSKDELNEMYLKLYLNGIGALNSTFYWSSTEVDQWKAWDQVFNWPILFGGGDQGNSHKQYSNKWRVRAIRAF